LLKAYNCFSLCSLGTQNPLQRISSWNRHWHL